MKGIVVAGTHSGSGKTTVTLALLSALVKMGYRVQPFKAGPDFIDPGLHKMITGRPSRNLDLWMCGEDGVRTIFETHTEGQDFAVIEGVMGLYDGEYSTSKLAELLGLPVLLVVDAYGMAESAGAVVKGFLEYGGERRPLIKGVFFNRVGSERHFKHLSKGISIPVIGFLPKDNDIEIPHRHLGLVTSEERPISEDGIRKLAELFIENTDIKHLIEDGFSEYKRRKPLRHVKAVRKDLKIGVAYDEAFSFYYEDNLDLLQHCGAEIVYFSPIRDRKIPEGVDGLYIGGGYPELYAEELSVNLEMKNSIREFVDDGGVVYAECGGFIYLTEGIETEDGKFHEMAGIFPCSIRYSDRLKALGYREVTVKRECIIGKKGMKGRGHEFRYTEISKLTGEMINVYDGKAGGYQVKNCLSSYIHLHFMSNPEIAANLVDFIRRNNEQG